jgi:hypothetical protein
MTSACGHDFSKIKWDVFNNDNIIELYGKGCGYDPTAPASKHVYYDGKDDLWIGFDVIENDNWLVGVEVSKKPLCDQQIQPLQRITSCQSSKALEIGVHAEEILKKYGKGAEIPTGVRYTYNDIGVGAEVYFDSEKKVTGYKVYSLTP